MADATKTETAPVHPLKRLLRKASRSKTSVVVSEEGEAATPEPRQQLERIASIAVTVPDENFEPSEQQQAEATEEPQSPITPGPPKEAKRRASLVNKLKGLAGNKKEKKIIPATDGVVEQTEDNDGDTPSRLSAQGISIPGAVKPTDIAKRVRDLLTSAPPFYPTTLVAAETRPPASSDGALGDLMGAKFLSTLSDHLAMSGSLSQESVWSILDRTKFSFQANVQGDFATLAEAAQPDNSIMLTAPLFPDEDSQVELAEFHLIKVPLDELDEAILSAAGWWPPWEWGKGPKPGEPPTKVVRVWVPSTTKVSVQLAWWGYRIWLPPPVMKVLGDKSIEAVKRASIIATALGWLVNHIPTAGLPIELVAVLTVAKALVPIIGYVGGFISWYWSTVQSFDKGQGVVLSATWLLPIALIPGNWDYTPPASDTPSNPSQPAPTPAPSNPNQQPPAPSNPPVGTSPPPSMPSMPPPSGGGSPIVTIPGTGGIYQA